MYWIYVLNPTTGKFPRYCVVTRWPTFVFSNGFVCLCWEHPELCGCKFPRGSWRGGRGWWRWRWWWQGGRPKLGSEPRRFGVYDDGESILNHLIDFGNSNMCLMFTPIWGRLPSWLVFFRWWKPPTSNRITWHFRFGHLSCCFIQSRWMTLDDMNMWHVCFHSVMTDIHDV